jgi:hypothetical protein
MGRPFLCATLLQAMIAGRLANLSAGGDMRSDQSARLRNEQTTQDQAADAVGIGRLAIMAGADRSRPRPLYGRSIARPVGFVCRQVGKVKLLGRLDARMT